MFYVTPKNENHKFVCKMIRSCDVYEHKVAFYSYFDRHFERKSNMAAYFGLVRYIIDFLDIKNMYIDV